RGRGGGDEDDDRGDGDAGRVDDAHADFGLRDVVQILALDRDEEGEVFSWLSRARLWSLQFSLTWQPYGGGGSGITMADTERMPLCQAVAWHRWIVEQREHEGASIRRAQEEARGGAKR